MKWILCALFLSFSMHCAAGQLAEKAILAVLQKQVSAWNDGDINRYMAGYWHSDSLVFIGKKGCTYGYEATLNNYKKAYPDKSAMGQLHFSDIRFKRISRRNYMVIGAWHLQRSIGNLDGCFSLLLRKSRREWHIIADHSS
jgi:hypothetical protein